MMPRGWGPITIAALVLLLGGCEKHMQDMYDQPRYKPLAASPLFADGGASRPPVPGTELHARGGFSATSSDRLGTSNVERWSRDELATHNPYPVTLDLLKQGQAQFTIYCTPCHSPLGDGDGFIVRRGFPAPPSYHIDRLRNAPDRHFFDVMTNGYGIMYPYADRITPADRWAIVAYIRALQVSQHIPAAELNESETTYLHRTTR